MADDGTPAAPRIFLILIVVFAALFVVTFLFFGTDRAGDSEVAAPAPQQQVESGLPVTPADSTTVEDR